MSEGDDKRRPAVPDLVIPPPRPSGAGFQAVTPPAANPVAPPRIDLALDDFGEMEIERGGGTSLPPMSSAPLPSRAPVSSLAPRPSHAPVPSRAPVAVSGSGLDVAYRREDARTAPRLAAPSMLVHVAAWLLTVLPFGGALYALLRHAHRPGRTFTGLLPHAFDATSLVQSAGVAIACIVVGVLLGALGLKLRPRSLGMLGAAALLLLMALAMVTVALVATEEGAPADGALLVPYLLPTAVALLGLGVAHRARFLFRDGGVGARVLAPVVSALGGAAVFAALEFSSAASRLAPHL